MTTLTHTGFTEGMQCRIHRAAFVHIDADHSAVGDGRQGEDRL